MRIRLTESDDVWSEQDGDISILGITARDADDEFGFCLPRDPDIIRRWAYRLELIAQSLRDHAELRERPYR